MGFVEHLIIFPMVQKLWNLANIW